MLNEKIANLLESRKEAGEKHAELKKRADAAWKECSDLQNKIGQAFAESFTGTNEEIQFMLSLDNNSDAMYLFRSKFLAEKKLKEAGYHTDTRQLGIAVNLYNDEADLRSAAEALKSLFPLIKPVVMNGWNGKETKYTLVNLNISSVVDYEKFSDNVYLIKEGDLYQATTIENRHNKVIADWSDDIAEVMIKAKEYLEYYYGHDESDDWNNE